MSCGRLSYFQLCFFCGVFFSSSLYVSFIPYPFHILLPQSIQTFLSLLSCASLRLFFAVLSITIELPRTLTNRQAHTHPMYNAPHTSAAHTTYHTTYHTIYHATQTILYYTVYSRLCTYTVRYITARGARKVVRTEAEREKGNGKGKSLFCLCYLYTVAPPHALSDYE
jgi:hypothetical protein